MLRYQAKEKASMEKATIIGIDLAKRVFQVHAASKDGRPVLRKKVSRAQLLGIDTLTDRSGRDSTTLGE
jgi:transposase